MALLYAINNLCDFMFKQVHVLLTKKKKKRKRQSLNAVVNMTKAL